MNVFCQNRIHFMDPLCLLPGHHPTTVLWSPSLLSTESPMWVQVRQSHWLDHLCGDLLSLGDGARATLCLLQLSQDKSSGGHLEDPLSSQREHQSQPEHPHPLQEGGPKDEHWRLSIPIGNELINYYLWVSCYTGTILGFSIRKMRDQIHGLLFIKNITSCKPPYPSMSQFPALWNGRKKSYLTGLPWGLNENTYGKHPAEVLLHCKSFAHPGSFSLGQKGLSDISPRGRVCSVPDTTSATCQFSLYSKPSRGSCPVLTSRATPLHFWIFPLHPAYLVLVLVRQNQILTFRKFPKTRGWPYSKYFSISLTQKNNLQASELNIPCQCQGTSFWKGPDRKYFWLCKLYGLWCNYSTPWLEHKSSHRQCASELTWLCSNKILFAKAGSPWTMIF